MDASNPKLPLLERYRFATWVYVTLAGCAAWSLLLGGVKTLLMFVVPVLILQGTLIPWLTRFGKRGIAIAFMAGWFPWMVLVWAVFFVAKFDFLGDLNYTLKIVGAQFIATVASLVDRCLKAELRMKSGALRD
jgi:hypothetical protein